MKIKPLCHGSVRSYPCGTLTYTLRSLSLVFIWLMIGGMALSVFTMLPGRMLPVKLQALGVSDLQSSFILAVIGGTLNIVVCPIVGFKSDRYRSRWGRRIPFILMSLPFISLSLILFGFGDRIGNWLAAATSGWGEVAPVTMTVLVIALVMFMFQFANMYVNSVFWYIFNDVIPAQFFGRVMGAFQVASTAGIAVFNFYIFQYAAAWYTEIFVTAGILYLIGMGLMCVMVKEGEYPPVTGEAEAEKKIWYKTLWLFCRESCCSRFYILRYMLTSMLAIFGVAAVFSYYYNREMGLDDNLIGKMDGACGIATFVITLGVTAVGGVLIDRWHPVRIYIYWALFAAAGCISGWKWLFGVLPGETFMWVSMMVSIGGSFLGVICSIAMLPMEMLTFPKSRFGSFCSAQALIRSLLVTLFSLLVGGLFDWLRGCFPGSATFHYRFVPVWSIVWIVPASAIAYITYREWNRLGGYKHYQAPAIWAPDGKEAVVQPETHAPNAGLLRFAIHCFDVIVLVLFSGILILACGNPAGIGSSLSRDLLVWALPAQTGVGTLWWWVRRSILRDMELAQHGKVPQLGIPHHGLLLLVAIRQFVFAVLGLYQVWVIGEDGGLAFMLAEISACLGLVLTVYAAAWMEKGIVTEVVAGHEWRTRMKFPWRIFPKKSKE